MYEIQIACVIVLYKNALTEAKAIQSLIDCCTEQTGLAKQLSVLIYDNSPSAHEVPLIDIPFGVMEYHHDAQNGGLAKAYNYALEGALGRNTEWLIILDQDTVVTASLFTALAREIAVPPPANVIAIVPKLAQNGMVISPQIVGQLRNDSVSARWAGISEKHLTALNSAACLRVSAVVGIGGFPQEYWLDYLDHIMFHRLQAVGGRLMVLDITLQHRLSLLNLEDEMTIERYINMLASEWKFIRETSSAGGSLVHRLRLLKRAFTLYTELNTPGYALKTLRAVID